MQQAQLVEAGGRLLSLEDQLRLTQAFGASSTAHFSALARMPLCGAHLILDSGADESGLGVDTQVFNASEVLDEAFNVYPGKLAQAHGLVPFGMCLEGSGDPYFVALNDGGIVRIPHDAARGGELRLAAIERIAESVEAFVARATSGADVP